MIRFKCKNCGRGIRAPDKYAGRKSKCPKCKEPLTVPNPKEPKAIKNKAQTLADKPNAEIAKKLLEVKPAAEPEQRKRRLLVPHYDETTLFVMSIMFIILLLTSSDMRTFLYKVLFEVFDIRVLILFMFFASGIPFSIYHAFSTRKKSVGEKAVMLLFAVYFSAVTGIYAGNVMLETSAGWLIIFPAYNIISGILLLIMFRIGLVDIHCISDQNATTGQITLALISAIIIFICCQYFFKLHWAITYSICIAYTTSLDKAVRSAFSLSG